jgi:hypothetical protein
MPERPEHCQGATCYVLPATGRGNALIKTAYALSIRKELHTVTQTNHLFAFWPRLECIAHLAPGISIYR